MPFRDRFDCLWCGTTWATRRPTDLEGWAQLCPTCLGRAGTNGFLRGRLRAALAERSREGHGGARVDPVRGPVGPLRDPTGKAGDGGGTVPAPPPRRPTLDRADPRDGATLVLPDGWFLRRDAYARGAVHDTAWTAELDVVTRWLDGQSLTGRILEPSAGVGFFSPLLAERGELFVTDLDGSALDRARERLIAHGLRAHLHVADPWEPAAPGDPPADAIVAAFLVGRVREADLGAALASFRARLRSGGRLALVDLRPDPAGGPPPGASWTYHDPELIAEALRRAAFRDVSVTETGRFFLLGSGIAD